MNLTKQIAKQFREVYLSGKWIANTNLKQELTAVDWQQATTKVASLNTIAVLAFHLNYYVAGLVQVLEGGTLDIRDKYSFDAPPITSQQDWEDLLSSIWENAERFASLVEVITEAQLKGAFVMEEYGTYYQNIHGMIEHGYYHLGQIVLIKKLLLVHV